MHTHPSILATILSLSCTALLASTGIAAASNTGPGDDEPWSVGAEISAAASGATSQESSASAWAESSGDHGITVTTTRSGDSTSCMVVEWKKENGVVRKWQYRCDAGKP